MLPFYINGIWLIGSERRSELSEICAELLLSHSCFNSSRGGRGNSSMYIHSCRLGMAGEVMCLSSVSDCQNKVHTVLQLHCCTVASGEPVAFGGNIWARVLCDKIIAVYEFPCLLWDTFWGLRKQLAGKREAATPEYSTTDSFHIRFISLVFWNGLSGA